MKERMRWKIGIVLVVISILSAVVLVSGCVYRQGNSEPNDPKPARIDSDGDGMSDWFEENVAQLDPNVSNDRYILWMWVYSYEPHQKEALNEIFIEMYRFLPENVIIIERATFSDFKRIVNQLAEKSDENDLVYIYIGSHGSGPNREFETITNEPSNVQVRFTGRWINRTPIMQFANEKGGSRGELVTYKEIGEMLNKIRCKKMLVTYDSCAVNTAVEVLNNGSAYPRVVIGPTCFVITNQKRMENRRPYYHLKDDYLSVKDFFKYHPGNFPEERVEQEVQRIEESIQQGTIFRGNPGIDLLTLKMSDPHNISSRFYFGEATVGELYEKVDRPRVIPARK